MISVIFLVLAFILFVVAGCNQDLFNQGPADLVAFGLASWVLSVILSGFLGGPNFKITKE